MSKLAFVPRLQKSTLTLAALLCLLPAAWAAPSATSFTDMVGKFVLMPDGAPETNMLANASAAVKFMQRMELPQASRAINDALQLAPGNSQLHFLNAFVYHLQAEQGDSQKSDMAIEGYQQALRIDPDNWIAQEFLGLALLDYGRFADARTQFAQVLMMIPDSVVSINGMMTAAYLTGTPLLPASWPISWERLARRHLPARCARVWPCMPLVATSTGRRRRASS